MTEKDVSENLWMPHTDAEIKQIYADWAAQYESDVADWGYVTPTRIALALRQVGANIEKPVLDFGCGTGLSGMALKAVGFQVVDGTDVSPEMLAQAETKPAYRQVWIGVPGSMGHIKRGDYPIIAATGVVSLGAAPPETLHQLIDAIGPGGLLAFSYNDATLADRRYTDALDIAVLAPDIEVEFEEHGAHLAEKDMMSTVYVLRRT